MGVGTGPVVLGAGVAALGYALAKGVVSGATLTSVAIVGGGLSVGYLTMIKVLLERMHSSVGIAPPTPTQQADEDPTKHALFRHLPGLSTKLAWRRLGTFPTPVHRGECGAPPTPSSATLPEGTVSGSSAETVRFYVKREDLSSPLYGGNKVRTLEHQIAVVEATNEAHTATHGGRPRDLLVFGSGGSNQVVATIVHGLHRFGMSVSPVWVPDPPDLDNTLNMLSALSFPIQNWYSWGAPFPMLSAVFGAAFGSSASRPILLPMGGNNPSGVLGQIAGPLELAEQIERGEVPDIDGIYVAVGSGCTVSGIILGVTLARHLGLQAFQSPDFKIHACPIVDTFATLHRGTGFYTAAWSQYFPLTIQHSIRRTCEVLVKLGGPDILEEALEMLAHHTDVHDDASIIGTYGVHSTTSRTFAKLFDDTVTLTPVNGADHGIDPLPRMWLCGHFCAKAFYAMASDLQKPENRGKNLLFWQTKSAVQPRGAEDEWSRMQAMPSVVQTWACKGKAESKLRPGSVDTNAGTAEDYRGLTTRVKGAE